MSDEDFNFIEHAMLVAKAVLVGLAVAIVTSHVTDSALLGPVLGVVVYVAILVLAAARKRITVDTDDPDE